MRERLIIEQQLTIDMMPYMEVMFAATSQEVGYC